MASKGILKNSRSSNRMGGQQDAGSGGAQPQPGPTVVFGRRTDSGRFISYSRDDLDSEISSMDFQDYHVHIPMTPDNQPMDEPIDPRGISAKVEEQYVNNSLFTGGFNTITRAHLMDKPQVSFDFLGFIRLSMLPCTNDRRGGPKSQHAPSRAVMPSS
ncbi:Cellulose synthase-like protein D1 [Ananas comosus]|uniref:Cellulose synthase-like protein D1 n=1 Tax=Ananas comosus TaxID=4615 RepID=A0A199VEY8_ANACO|nr:Cellulose synthase-like protein D1 [Ananas comosus]